MVRVKGEKERAQYREIILRLTLAAIQENGRGFFEPDHKDPVTGIGAVELVKGLIHQIADEVWDGAIGRLSESPLVRVESSAPIPWFWYADYPSRCAGR